jgi:protein O-GlcNAc transferase
MADAEACFRKIVEKFPTHADALHLLGVVAIATQRHAAGVELIGQAIPTTETIPIITQIGAPAIRPWAGCRKRLKASKARSI